MADTPPVVRPPRRQPPPGLLRREAAARFCSAGLSTWDRLTAAGMTPTPVRLGGSVFWGRDELRAWIAHGCPPRSEWSPIWSAILAARRSGRGN